MAQWWKCVAEYSEKLDNDFNRFRAFASVKSSSSLKPSFEISVGWGNLLKCFL